MGPYLEFSDQFGEDIRLPCEGSAGGRGLLDHRRILLGDLIHLIESRIDLPKRRGLFIGADRDLRDDLIDLRDLANDGFQRSAALGDEFGSTLYITARSQDQTS